MARPTKKGFDYFPFDVGFFSDRKVKTLHGQYGSDGINLYIYLLCEIYKNDGYYLKWDEDLDYIIASDLNLKPANIGLIRKFLLERSMFNEQLFKSDNVLTSVGIQRRYAEMVKSRASKNTVQIIEKYWLLSKDETPSYIKVRQKSDYSKNNDSYSENNPSNSENNSTKESKVNKNKTNNIYFDEISLLKQLPQAQQEAFKKVWKAYPVKDNKIGAIREWKKAKIDLKEIDTMLSAIKIMCLENKPLKFIPLFKNWIIDRRWQDASIQKQINRTKDTEDILGTAEEYRPLYPKKKAYEN